jgi:hypothetical protein
MSDIECRMPDVNCAVEFCGHRYCLRAYANNTGDSDKGRMEEMMTRGVRGMRTETIVMSPRVSRMRTSKIAEETRTSEQGEHVNKVDM